MTNEELKQRLIELLKPFVSGSACEHESGSCELTDCRSCNARNLADHLIANGVTIRDRGEWDIIMDDYDCEMMQCSVCKEMFYDGDNDTVDTLPDFCPHCGSDMRGDSK